MITLLYLYIVTLLHDYTVTLLRDYIVTSLHDYIVTFLHDYIVTLLRDYIVTLLRKRKRKEEAEVIQLITAPPSNIFGNEEYFHVANYLGYIMIMLCLQLHNALNIFNNYAVHIVKQFKTL